MNDTPFDKTNDRYLCIHIGSKGEVSLPVMSGHSRQNLHILQVKETSLAQQQG